MKPEDVPQVDVASFRLAARQHSDPLSDEAVRAGLASVLTDDRVRRYLRLAAIADEQGRSTKLSDRVIDKLMGSPERAIAKQQRDLFLKLAAIENGDE